MASAVIPQINQSSHLSTNESSHLPINQSSHQQINQSSQQSIHQSTVTLTSEELSDLGAVGSQERYSCKFCKKLYSSPHSLRTHEKWHTGDLKHKCSFCDKKFRNPSELKRHEMTHTGERPHKCPHCSMKFIQKTSLREHIEKKHPLEQPLSDDPKPPSLDSATNIPHSIPSTMEHNQLTCKFCQKAFTDKQSLLQHEEKEAKEFEALHESFEEAEFKELDNFGLQEYLPHGLPDVKALTGVDFGTFMDQLETAEIPDLGATLPPLNQKSTLSSGFNNNNNLQETGLKMMSSSGDAQLFHNFVPDLSEDKNPASTFLQIPVNGLAKIEVKSEEESKPVVLNQLQDIKVEQKPSPGFQTAPDQIKSESTNTQPFNTPNQVKIELDTKPETNLLPSTNSSESDTSENEDAIIQQYFDELEGQFPHLRSKLAPTTLSQTSMSPVPNYQTILVQHSVLKSESDQIISADSPRYTGASTPVDTIQASSLTQLSPPIYNNASRLSPLQNQPNSIVNLVQNNTPFVPVSNQAVISRPPQTDHINSLLQSNADQTFPMARTPLNVNSTTNDLLPPRSIQASVLPAAPVETFQTVQTVELPQQQYYQTVQIDSNHPPVYQIQDTGQIDPYTEGILNQIEGKISNWTELSYTGTFHTSQDSNELFTVTSISSKNPSQIVTAIQQPQVCSANLQSGESYQVHTTYFDENGQQYEPVNGQWTQAFESSGGQIGQSGNLQVIQLPNQADSEINLPGGPWLSGKPSLPKRWKMRTVESSMGTRMIKKSQFLAPDGQFFESRKSALDHMIRAGIYTNEDIDTMRKGLRNKTSFEWESGGEYVPPGWKTREKISTDNKTRLFFLSPGGISFPSRRAAFDHMIKDGKYSKVDIDTMKAGLRSRRMERKDFIVGDPSVPVGWKIRINDQMKESFRSPSGVFFHSRQTVLEHLIKEGYPQTDIALVQSKLTSGRKKRRKRSAAGDEKWIDNDQTVPGGWKMRVVNCSDGHAVTFFKTPDGTTLKGRKAALDHMLKTGVYSEKDIDIMKSHLNVISRVSDMWVPGDPTLPAGWKIKKYKSKTSVGRVHCEYLSPQNHVFRSRKAVVEHMRKTGAYSKEDILKVEAGNTKYKGQKRLLSFDDGWIESEALPKGWRLKRHLEGEQRIFKYLSPCGKEVWSHEAMLEEISKSGNCSQEDIEKLYRIVGSPTKTPRTMPSVSLSTSVFPLTTTSVSKSTSIPISLESTALTLPPPLSVPTPALMSPIENDLIPSTDNLQSKQSSISQSTMQTINNSATTSLTAAPTNVPSPISATVQASILSSKLPSCTRVSILPSSLETTTPPSVTQHFSTNVIPKTTQLILEPNPNLKASVSSLNSSGSVICSSASQNILNSQMSAKPAKITQIATKSTHLIKKPIPSAVNNNLTNKILSPSLNSFFATKSAPPPKSTQSITPITSESPITVLPKNEIKSTAFSTLLKELPNCRNPQVSANEQNKNKLLSSLRPHHETIISKLKEERLPKLKNSELGWKTGNSTLPQGWKVRTHFWWDREKQTFMAPDGTVFGSRKAVLKQMEADGSYDETDFEKVRRGLKRKGRRKQTSQKKEELTEMQEENLKCNEERTKLMGNQENGGIGEEEEGNLDKTENNCDVLEKRRGSFETNIEEKDENKMNVNESLNGQEVLREMKEHSEIENNEEKLKKKIAQEKEEKGKDKATESQEINVNDEEKIKPVEIEIVNFCKKQIKSQSSDKAESEGRRNCIKSDKESAPPNTTWVIDASEVDIEEELDNVAEAEILKEIEEDEIMNDAEEVEILQQEKKIKLLSESNVEKSNKIYPCFVKIFRLANTQMNI